MYPYAGPNLGGQFGALGKLPNNNLFYPLFFLVIDR